MGQEQGGGGLAKARRGRGKVSGFQLCVELASAGLLTALSPRLPFPRALSPGLSPPPNHSRPPCPVDFAQGLSPRAQCDKG